MTSIELKYSLMQFDFVTVKILDGEKHGIRMSPKVVIDVNMLQSGETLKQMAVHCDP